MDMRIKFLFFFWLFISTFSFAQEELTPLLRKQNSSEQIGALQHKSARNLKPVFLLYDTLELPFIDDFAKNRIRSTTIIDDRFAIDTFKVLFKVNNQITDSFKLVSDTTYFNIYDSVSGTFTLIPQLPQIVIFYQDSLSFGTPTDTIIGFNAIEYEIIGTDTTIYRLPPTLQGANQIDSIILAADNPYYLWTTNGAFWNNALAINPPTLGFVSFDGTDKYGLPYDNTLPNAFGMADILTSKPINLNYPSTDSIYLSFFYQPQGYGEKPNVTDSLVLQFLDVENDVWKHAWSAEGKALEPFTEVFIFISDSTYLQDGFQFRFLNYATLSGNFDMWHIDYVRLARFRRNNEPIDDLAFVRAPETFLNDYVSVPWKQYKRNPGLFTKTDFLLDLNNLSENGKVFTNIYSVSDNLGNNLINSTPVIQPYNISGPSAPAQSPFRVQHFLNKAPNSFTFPTNYPGKKRMRFNITNTTSTTPDINRENDTLRYEQIFDSYFSYDDGTAEQAYSINEAGAMLAYQFEIPYGDTLKAVLINFPEMLEDQSDRRFRIMVWKDLTEGPIYEDVLRAPITAGAHNFIRFKLAEEVLVNGEFYIGWMQTLPKKLYVGFDFNNNNQSKIYYSVNNGLNFYNTSFSGSLLIRPDFGEAQVDVVGVDEAMPKKVEKEQGFTFSISPNPAISQATLKINNPAMHSFQLVDVTGRVLETGYFTYSHTINIEHLKNGMYFLQVTNQNTQQTTVEPLMIK